MNRSFVSWRSLERWFLVKFLALKTWRTEIILKCWKFSFVEFHSYTWPVLPISFLRSRCPSAVFFVLILFVHQPIGLCRSFLETKTLSVGLVKIIRKELSVLEKCLFDEYRHRNFPPRDDISKSIEILSSIPFKGNMTCRCSQKLIYCMTNFVLGTHFSCWIILSEFISTSEWTIGYEHRTIQVSEQEFP